VPKYGTQELSAQKKFKFEYLKTMAIFAASKQKETLSGSQKRLWQLF
jgi:hypothetical protein